MFFADVKTAVNYVTMNKMADQNSGPSCSTRTLCPVGVFTRVSQSHSYICRIHKINYYKMHISHILIASRNCPNMSCHVGPYTGGFSCSCNLVRLPVTGGAIGVVAISLLERGEFGGSNSLSCADDSGICLLLFLSAPGVSTFSDTCGSWSKYSCSCTKARNSITCGSRS